MALYDDGIDHHDEAMRLLEIIKQSPAWPGGSQFSAKDMAFVRSLSENPDRPVSQRMIFWLRDIRDRSL